MHIAKRVAREEDASKNLVAILADDGFRYGAHFYDDVWLNEHEIQPNPD